MGSKKLRNRNKPKRPSPAPKSVTLLNYDITFEVLEEDNFNHLPEAVKEQTRELRGLISTNPGDAIPELVELIRQYPNVPLLSNYLHAAYAKNGDPDAAHAVMLESCHKFPDYLFAKLSYGEFLLDADKPEEFAQLFDHKFDLKLLFPERTVFHISEYAAFSALVGWYYCLTGKAKLAHLVLESLQQLAPDHAGTQMLKNQIVMAAFKALTTLMSNPEG